MRVLLKVLGAAVAIFFTVVFVTLTFTFIRKVWFGATGNQQDHVAVISVEGMLVSARDTLKYLKVVRENPGAKALVVRVNSPGGLVAPSQEIYEALRRLDEKIPVIISMGPLAASGGYYVSLGGRKIFANPGTLTASIGVIIEMVNTQKLYEWAKVERFALSAGKFKETGTPFRPMRPEERELLMNMIHEIHAQFRGAVKERRKLTDAELENTADGRVMTGSQAHKAKLVDTLGGYEDALAEARKLAGLDEDAPVRRLEPPQGALREFLLGETSFSLPPLLKPFFLEIPEDGVFLPGYRILLVSQVR